MKWIFGFFMLSVVLTSCDNELVVADKWKDIPIVWGLLNAADTAHYIRVEKAYLDPNTSALTIAKIPDSLYYENATVFLKRIATGQEFELDRVDGTLEGFPRDTGVFAHSPNYLYKIKSDEINLIPGEEYQFILRRGDNTAPVTAETLILPQPVLRNPDVDFLLGFKRNSLFLFSWNEIPEARIFEIHIRFHYHEKNAESGGFFIPKQVEWTVVKNLTTREYNMDGGDFYSAVRSNLEVDPTATRIFDSLDIIVWAGGKEMAEFIKITQANTGITGTQDIPQFTNLSEGLGLFSSRSKSTDTGFRITTLTLDSLRNSVTTKPLNFQ